MLMPPEAAARKILLRTDILSNGGLRLKLSFFYLFIYLVISLTYQFPHRDLPHHVMG